MTFRDQLTEVPDPEAAPKADVFFHTVSFYNRHWHHSTLDYLSPEAYEQLCHPQDDIFA